MLNLSILESLLALLDKGLTPLDIKRQIKCQKTSKELENTQKLDFRLCQISRGLGIEFAEGKRCTRFENSENDNNGITIAERKEYAKVRNEIGTNLAMLLR